MPLHVAIEVVPDSHYACRQKAHWEKEGDQSETFGLLGKRESWLQLGVVRSGQIMGIFYRCIGHIMREKK